MRASYDVIAALAEGLSSLKELPTRTVIVDVEPLVAYWNNGQQALDQGVVQLLTRFGELPGLQVVCFATNSSRRPTRLPPVGGVQTLYIPSAGKPLRTAAYRDFPRPGTVIGDQVATDGVLAWRLGYRFMHYCPPQDRIPASPWLMYQCGRLIRPLLFSPPARRMQTTTG